MPFVVPWIACASPPSAAVAHDPVCGNGIVEGKEECDDGNQDNGDGCFTTCLKPLAWASAEPHVHGHGCSGQRGPSSLVQLLEEQSFDIGSALVWGHGYETDSLHFTGKDSADSTPGHILHYDLETSAMGPSKTGHLVLLGLHSLAYSNDIFYTPKSGVPVTDWARAQGEGVAVGLAHGQFWNQNDTFPSFPGPNCCLPPDDCCVPWELPVHTARGRLDFLATEGTSDSRGPVDTATWRIWRKLLNSGFRLTLAGGADYPCIEGAYAVKTPRTRFYLDGDPTYDKWLEALRLGHVVVTLAGGDDLNLRINGARIGSEVQVASAEAMTVAIDGRFAGSDTVEILANGAGVASIPVGPGAQADSIPLTLSKSSWIVARSAHDLTNPIYVIVDSKPVRASASDACYWARYMDYLSGIMRRRRLLGESEAQALRDYSDAKDVFLQRFAEAGGQACH